MIMLELNIINKQKPTWHLLIFFPSSKNLKSTQRLVISHIFLGIYLVIHKKIKYYARINFGEENKYSR